MRHLLHKRRGKYSARLVVAHGAGYVATVLCSWQLQATCSNGSLEDNSLMNPHVDGLRFERRVARFNLVFTPCMMVVRWLQYGMLITHCFGFVAGGQEAAGGEIQIGEEQVRTSFATRRLGTFAGEYWCVSVIGLFSVFGMPSNVLSLAGGFSLRWLAGGSSASCGSKCSRLPCAAINTYCNNIEWSCQLSQLYLKPLITIPFWWP